MSRRRHGGMIWLALGSLLLVIGGWGLRDHALNGANRVYPAPGHSQPQLARPISLSDPRQAALGGEPVPAPTEIADWKAARKDRKLGRIEWYESLHRCPPDVEWRKIEDANRRAASLERFARISRGERTQQWSELGSVNLAGRTHAAFPSLSGERLYVGSDLGGVWRGTPQGEDWQALADGLGCGSHELLVAASGARPEDGEVVTTMAGNSIHVSADGGLTWVVPAGLPDWVYDAIRVVRDCAHPGTVYLLTRGQQTTAAKETVNGYLISRSTDGGLTYELRYAFPATVRADLWIDRVAGGPLYAMVGRTLYGSTDQGLTFNEVGSAPAGTVSDVILTASEAGAPTFYAALCEGGNWNLYRSTDGGAHWTLRYLINDFWETLLASITDPDLVFFAGVECYRSVDGGGQFTKVNEWWEYYADPLNRLHADLPGMNAHMIDGQEAIYFNTDGGTYVSYDGGAAVQNISLWGLAISQYYDILTSGSDPYLIAAGSQDQGYQQALPPRDERNGYLPFEQLISGDYGHLTSADRDHNWLYSVYPGFVLLQVSEIYPQNLRQLDFPVCAHSWMPTIVADPRDPDVFYFCGDHLWKYARTDGYYYQMTELPHNFSSGGSYLTALAISPADPDYWFAATNVGVLWFSHDAGAHWTQAGQGPQAHYFYGTALQASPHDRDVAYVGGSGYAGHPVWRTADGGVTWLPMGSGLPNTLVLGLALGGETLNDLYAATQAGPFGFDAQAGSWISLLGTEAPLTTYWCLEWVPELNAVRFGTYGRGIWDYQLMDPAALAEDRGRRAGPELQLTPNPAAEHLTLRFALASAGQVDLELFDVTGRSLLTAAAGDFAAGTHAVTCDLRHANLPAGIYLARLCTPEGVTVRKLQVASR